MKTRNLIAIVVIAILTLSGCEKMILGTNEENSPENCFEILWKDFDAHYATFTPKNIDWNALYKEYRPMVNQNTTEDELWGILTSILEHLDDGHVTLIQPIKGAKDRFFESGSTLNDIAEDEFSLPLIESKYLDYLSTTRQEDISFGKLKGKDVGYIHLYGLEGEDPTLVDSLIDVLKQHKSIIVDVRNNGGGYDSYAHRFAGAFADGEHFIYTVQTKNGEGKDDFDAKTEWYTSKEGDEQYLKPVIFLTDRYTASAAEILTFNMRAFEHVTHMGDTTAGDHSDISSLRFLPNGWIYTTANQLYLTPAGECLGGVGIAPAVYSKNTENDILNNEDKVLETAIDYLWTTYGIE